MRLPWALAGAAVWLAAPAWAAPQAGSDTVYGVPRWLILAFNLAVFLGIIVYFAGPAVVRFLEDKKRDLRHAIEEAARQRVEAEQMAATLSVQIGELRREMDELLARAEREGERERGEVLAQAERESVRLRDDARQEIRHRLEQARQELTRHAVALASRLAEERLSQRLTPEDRRRLFQENLARLERRS
jgi:F-type H+-transporting ATPase subunit b